VIASLLAAAALAATSSCPVDGAAHLGRPHAELREAARDAVATDDASCARVGLAVLDVLDGDPAHACVAAERALRAGSGGTNDADALAFGGRLAWRCGRPEAAWRAARTAIERDAEATAAWTLLGDVLAARFHSAAARAAYERALELDPRETDALLAMAGLGGTRDARRAIVRRYLEAAESREVPRRRVINARERLELWDALGEREVFVIEDSRLPFEDRLDPVRAASGPVRGFVLDVDAGGRRDVPALLDSGASGLHLDPDAPEELPVEPLTDATIFGGGGDGAHEARRVIVPKLDLGPVVFKDALATTAERPLHPRGTYRAILGMEMFGRTRIRFDPGRGKVRVVEAPGWDAPSDPLEAEPFAVDDDEVPIVRVAGMLLVPATLRYDETTTDTLLLFDTGASATFLDAQVADELDAIRSERGPKLRGYGGRVQRVGTVRRAEIEIGGERRTVRRLPVFSLDDRARLTGIRVGGFLGLDWISREPVVLDFSRGTLRLAERERRRRRGR
jgi:Flp pilus assembly protein TadD